MVMEMKQRIANGIKLLMIVQKNDRIVVHGSEIEVLEQQ